MALGLLGSAINLPEGEVEVRVSGEAAAIERLAARLRQGPALARVERVSRSAVDPAADPATGFVIG